MSSEEAVESPAVAPELSSGSAKVTSSETSANLESLPQTGSTASAKKKNSESPVDSLDQCNVFIKYLPAEVNDSSLYALFSPFGQVTSCKVMIDQNTGYSLGYGFVRYSDPENAQSAIKAMCNRRLGNKTLLCKLSNTTPINRTSEPTTNLHIKPLPDIYADSAKLRQLFDEFGKITSCRIISKSGQQKAGIICFADQSEATAALEAMNGFKINDGQTLTVVYADITSNHSHNSHSQILPFPSAYMAQGQAMGATYQQAMFMAMNGYGGFPNGMPQRPQFQGQQMPHPNSSYPENPNEGVNLFVFHLPSAVDDPTLFRLFSPFGALESVKVITDRATGESKGYGFVKYFRMPDAIQAINALNGYKLGNKHLKVSFKSSRSI